ncbi:hypothetical protein CONLIGDRAFT_498965 [Coniochaeta ligniaria NRRL 30616]|uniref:DUF6604 domain-containing protein n=1 Tax=Coniochaeta ligniaria NRRL 30616 TaxID=1408157 RepID=A0A1J7J713_9PEZI|nr:hypothetical protein CONLIGDRAFT_498965 [Coniochaeta ligniaria NRRL 30616]
MEGHGGNFGTWRRYKIGQAQFTQWLKQTSEKLATRKEPDEDASGPIAEAASASTESASSRKKKKKGKDKISLVDSNGSSSDHSSVHWSQLEMMATTIVENADPDDIPDAPINILRDVVSLRKKSARFFNRLANDSKDETVKAKNATHEHILNVLDRVLGKFEGLRSRVHGRKEKPSGTVDVSDINNMFEHLEVQDAEAGAEDDDEQPSETESPVNGSSRKIKKNKNGVKKKGRKAQRSSRSNGQGSSSARSNGSSSSRLQPGRNWVDDITLAVHELDVDDPFDYYMLVYCFFEDFNIIRNYICERWCDYFYDGSVHLNTLAVITNAACEFFQQMEVDLRSVLGVRRRDLAQYTTMAQMLFIDYGIEHIDYDSYDDLDDDEANDRIFSEEADWLGLLTYYDMRQVLDNTPPGKVGTVPPSRMENPSDLYGATRALERRELIHRLVMEYMQEAATMKALKKNGFEDSIIPAETEVLLGFQRALESRLLPSFVVFSMQLYVDIRAIMEHKVGDAFADMQRTGQWVDQTMDAHKSNATGPRASLLKHLNGWQRDNRHYMLEDITLVDKNHRFEVMRINEPVPQFALHKADPIWAGLLDFRAKLITNDLGDRFASRVPLIEAAAYLYWAATAAAAKTNTTLPAWTDMDKFMDTYSEDSQFKLGLLQAPESAFAILNNWENMMAIFVTPDVSARSKAIAGRKLAQSIGIRTSLIRRYSWEEKEAHLSDPTTLFYCQELVMHRLRIVQDKYESEANTERILAAAREREANGGQAVGKMLRATGLDGDKPLLAPMKIDDEAEKELRRRAMLAQLSPLEVLKILDDSVTLLLEGVLSLDYFKLWDESVALLRAVNEAYSPEFRARVADKGTEPDCFAAIPILIAEELKASAAEHPSGAGTLGVLVQSVRKYLEENTLPS